jgi:hypothetical protein
MKLLPWLLAMRQGSERERRSEDDRRMAMSGSGRRRESEASYGPLRDRRMEKRRGERERRVAAVPAGEHAAS